MASPCSRCDVHTWLRDFTPQVLLAATLQPMSEPAQRSDVVLFNFIFGPSPYTMPTFPFFLQSAEYSGADIVFVGDTPIINADETGIFYGAPPINQYVPHDAARGRRRRGRGRGRGRGRRVGRKGATGSGRAVWEAS